MIQRIIHVRWDIQCLRPSLFICSFGTLHKMRMSPIFNLNQKHSSGPWSKEIDYTKFPKALAFFYYENTHTMIL